jgi:16S rRNA (uracil1498-N3)-methyltransferase
VRRLEFLPESHEPSVRLSLLQGLAKGDKMDFIVQKAVELGVSAIYPVAMENAVVKLDAAKAARKVERWQKIAAAAAQQSKRDFIPTVHEVLDFRSALAASGSELLLLAYEEEQQAGLRQVLQEHPEVQSLAIIIGPEGGIAPAELQAARAAGAVSVSLGTRVLRTETAGLVAAAAIFYETGNLG